MELSFIKENAQYFHFLISGLENDVWGLIGELDHAQAQEKPPLRAQILSALACFIAVADAIGEPLPYRDLDGFLQNGNPDGGAQTARLRNLIAPDGNTAAPADPWPSFRAMTERTIVRLIRAVLADDENDPEWSAVYAVNMIKSACAVFPPAEGGAAPADAAAFFRQNGFSAAQYQAFEARRKKEAVDYIGTQL